MYLSCLLRFRIFTLDALELSMVSTLSLTSFLQSELGTESVLLFPPHGIQLETHRGPFGPLFASRKFIPSDYFLDIIMNEGLRRWNVRYYLAAMVESPEHNLKLVVAFEVCSVSSLAHTLVLRILVEFAPTLPSIERSISGDTIYLLPQTALL